MRSKNACYCPGLIDKKRKLNNDLFQVSSSNYVEFAIHNVVLCTRGYPRNVCQQRYSLRSKRFQSSYSAKFGAGAKKKWKGEGEGRGGNPPPSFLFLLSFQFSRRTRAEPLATQANKDKSQFPKQEDTNGSD